MLRRIPPVLWISVVVLVFISVVGAAAGVSKGNTLLLATVALNLILALGLYIGFRWAYVGTLVFCLGSVISAVAAHRSRIPGSVLRSGLVAIPIVMSTKYFWGDRSAAESPEEPQVDHTDTEA